MIQRSQKSTLDQLVTLQQERNFTNTIAQSKGSQYNRPVYQFIREHGNWENWSMVQLLTFSCASKREKELKEREYIERLKPALNRFMPTRTKQEWEEENKEKGKQQAKEYREKNK